MVKLDLSSALPFLPGPPDSSSALRELEKLRGDAELSYGAGWLRLPREFSESVAAPINDAAARIRSDSDALVVVGAGGSFLGAKAATDLLARGKSSPEILFSGSDLSSASIADVTGRLAERDFSVNVISKSGSTLEPLAAFHVLYDLLRRRYGTQAHKRVYVTAGVRGGPLRGFAETSGATTFDIPEDVGGRYSVLTAVGLLPMASAGIDIAAVMSGALEQQLSGEGTAAAYAAARQALYRSGRKVEILAAFEPSLHSMARWWRQLFGESEGKNGRGIFPSVCGFTSDLHSMGQYIQDGERTIFETFVSLDAIRSKAAIPPVEGLSGPASKLAGRGFSALNALTLNAVKDAHLSGGVPVIGVSSSDPLPEAFGALVIFFETACAASALLSGVDPFDQPGVEAYKKRLYEALGLN